MSIDLYSIFSVYLLYLPKRELPPRSTVAMSPISTYNAVLYLILLTVLPTTTTSSMSFLSGSLRGSDNNLEEHLKSNSSRASTDAATTNFTSVPCSSNDTRLFQSTLLIEFQVDANKNNASLQSLHDQEQLWATILQDTYNDLAIVTICDQPYFRSILEVLSVQVQDYGADFLNLHLNQSLLNQSSDSALTTTTTTTSVSKRRGSLFQTATLGSTGRTLEFTLATECHSCDELVVESIFYSPPSLTPATTIEDEQQALDSQCQCATAALDKDFVLTPSLLQEALNQKLVQIQQEQKMLLNVQSIGSIIEAKDEGCYQEASPFQTSVLLDTSSVLPPTEPLDPDSIYDLALQFQYIYNSLNFHFCDVLHRRIRNVTIDTDHSIYRTDQIVFRIDAECQHCDTGTVRLFEETERFFTENITLPDVLVPAPIDACYCPVQQPETEIPQVDANSTILPQISRAVTADEIVHVWNHLLTLSSLPYNRTTTVLNLNTLQEVQSFECQAHGPESSPVIYTTVIVDLEGQPMDAEETAILEQSFLDTYNDMTFASCDAKFRSIIDVQFITIPLVVVSTTRRFTSRARQLEEAFFAGDTLPCNTSADNSSWGCNNETHFWNETIEPTPLSDEYGVPPLNQSTTAFRVGVECRRCPPDDMDTFGLFDEFRRNLKEVMESFLVASAKMHRNTQVNDDKSTENEDFCYCPIGSNATEDAAPTETDFLQTFNLRVEGLSQSGDLPNVVSVQALSQDPTSCISSMYETKLMYSIELEGTYEVDRLTEENLRSAFLKAAHSLRDFQCAPFVQDINAVTVAPSSLIYDLTVYESENDSFGNLLNSHQEELMSVFQSSFRPNTASPSTEMPTGVPSSHPTTASPTRYAASVTTSGPTVVFSTASPTATASKASLAQVATTSNPTALGSTASLTQVVTTTSPTVVTSTESPTASATTGIPTQASTTSNPTALGSTASPTALVTTSNPTQEVNTTSPTAASTANPTSASPSSALPTSNSPTHSPTAVSPSPSVPTQLPTSAYPSTAVPTVTTTEGTPSNSPTTSSSSPSRVIETPSTAAPTVTSIERPWARITESPSTATPTTGATIDRT